jgi:hypothetical protein
MDLLKVEETIQAGDIFLIRFKCFYCSSYNLNDWNNLKCDTCHMTCGTFFDFDGGKSKFRCLTGTKRKSLRFGKKKIQMLREIQSNTCAYCDQNLLNYHIDHVIPLSFGGTNNIGNLVLACPPCNLKAGSKVFPSFIAKRSFIRRARGISLH